MVIIPQRPTGVYKGKFMVTEREYRMLLRIERQGYKLAVASVGFFGKKEIKKLMARGIVEHRLLNPKEPDSGVYQIRKMLNEDTEQKCYKRHYYLQLAVRCVITFVLGLLFGGVLEFL